MIKPFKMFDMYLADIQDSMVIGRKATAHRAKAARDGVGDDASCGITYLDLAPGSMTSSVSPCQDLPFASTASNDLVFTLWSNNVNRLAPVALGEIKFGPKGNCPQGRSLFCGRCFRVTTQKDVNLHDTSSLIIVNNTPTTMF